MSGSFDLDVTSDGSLRLSRMASPFMEINSSFSEPGPVYNTFGSAEDTIKPWKVVVEQTSEVEWTVTAQGRFYAIERTIRALTNRILINETIKTHNATSEQPAVGIETKHAAFFTGAAAITDATVPGSLYPFRCNNINVDGRAKPYTQRGSFGNPIIHAASADGGVGILPLDDVFELHAYANQSALSRYPRMPKTSSCAVSSPPSISLHDPYLALPSNDFSYTQEWVVYLLPANCSDYWCLINEVRKDMGVDQMTMVGTGFLSFYQPARKEPFLVKAGYSGDWDSLSNDEFEGMMTHQGIHFVHAATPLSGRSTVCRKGALNCHGSCFVNELPESEVEYLTLLINKTKQLPTTRPVLLYVDTLLSGETNASEKYADSQIIDVDKTHVHYVTCEEGADYPMFYPTMTNSYGEQMRQYFAETIAMGFDGIYHDEFCASAVAYTFSEYDNHSAMLDPVTKAAAKPMGSICLLTQEHEILLMKMIKANNGSMVFNSQPTTRTVREYGMQGQQAGGQGGANLHFLEDSEETRVQFSHLFTPLTLNRFGAQIHDLDPKYNNTCKNKSDVAACTGANVMDNLDYGVASYLYDGLFAKGSSPPMLQRMFPLTALRIGPGMVIGKERIITKQNGTFRIDGSSAYEVFVYAGALEVDQYRVSNTTASISLLPGHAAIIVPA
jgi:hypothetical protein